MNLSTFTSLPLIKKEYTNTPDCNATLDKKAENAKAAFLTSAYRRELTDDCACQQLNLMSRRVQGKSKICLVLRSAAVEKRIIFFLTSRVDSVDNNRTEQNNRTQQPKSWGFFFLLLYLI